MKKIEDYSEDELADLIYKVARRIAYKFRFGYHEDEDMVQQAVLFVYEKDRDGKNALDKYDNKRPLENFIYVHIHNRLFNYKRDNYMRPDSVCDNCPIDEMIINNKCTKYEDKMECEFFSSCYNRNISRRNIMNTLDLGGINDYHEQNMKYNTDFEGAIDNDKLLSFIDKNIGPQFRQDYTYIKYGISLSKQKSNRLREEVFTILEKFKDDIQI
jgi:hypothetical protein